MQLTGRMKPTRQLCTGSSRLAGAHFGSSSQRQKRIRDGRPLSARVSNIAQTSPLDRPLAKEAACKAGQPNAVYRLYLRSCGEGGYTEGMQQAARLVVALALPRYKRARPSRGGRRCSTPPRSVFGLIHGLQLKCPERIQIGQVRGARATPGPRPAMKSLIRGPQELHNSPHLTLVDSRQARPRHGKKCSAGCATEPCRNLIQAGHILSMR